MAGLPATPERRGGLTFGQRLTAALVLTALLAAAAPTPPGAQTGAVFDGLKVDVGEAPRAHTP